MWSDAIDGPYSWIDHSQSSENIVLSVLTFLRLYTQGCTLCYLISRFQRFLTIKIESCFYLLGKQDCAGGWIMPEAGKRPGTLAGARSGGRRGRRVAVAGQEECKHGAEE